MTFRCDVNLTFSDITLSEDVIARALRRIADQLNNTDATKGEITDDDGNSVGTWTVAE